MKIVFRSVDQAQRGSILDQDWWHRSKSTKMSVSWPRGYHQSLSGVKLENLSSGIKIGMDTNYMNMSQRCRNTHMSDVNGGSYPKRASYSGSRIGGMMKSVSPSWAVRSKMSGLFSLVDPGGAWGISPCFSNSHKFVPPPFRSLGINHFKILSEEAHIPTEEAQS